MTFQNNFNPGSQTITGITNANPGVVTTALPHGYIDGDTVRIVFPPISNFGMNQVNGNQYIISVLSPNTFSIDQDTTNFDIFALGSNKQVPQVIPMAENAFTLLNAEKNADNIIPET